LDNLYSAVFVKNHLKGAESTIKYNIFDRAIGLAPHIDAIYTVDSV